MLLCPAGASYMLCYYGSFYVKRVAREKFTMKQYYVLGSYVCFYLCDACCCMYRIVSYFITDGFDAFKEAGNCFDRTTAARVRQFIYSTGNSLDPRDAFRSFRGRYGV
jgi:hypothetical protein